METITMWANKSSRVADARLNSSPAIDVQNVISDIDVAKIRKDAEIAIKNDEIIREQRFIFTEFNNIASEDRILFESEELAGDENRSSGKSLRKTMTICYERYQTKEEMCDAPYHNRAFAVYNVFLDDKSIKGSLNAALDDNATLPRH